MQQNQPSPSHIDQHKNHLRRYNNFSLRYLQLGIQLLICKLMSDIGIKNRSCVSPLLDMVFGVALVLIVVNVGFLLFLFVRKRYVKTVFYGILGIQSILVGVLMVLGLSQAAKSQICPNLKIMNKFVGIECLVALFLCVFIFYSHFNLAQRYANSPGNITWVFLFLGYPWTGPYKTIFIIIGVISLIISLLAIIINLVSYFIGMTIPIRKTMYFHWIASIILFLILGILGFITYLQNIHTTDYQQTMAKKLTQIFIGVNIIDILFWVWGFFVVKDQFGLTMRESLMVEEYSDHLENDLDNSQ